MNNYPKVGQFYYHFKHSPEKGILDYCYKIVGVCQHTETSHLYVAYRPLYSNSLEENQLDFFIRPIEMFTERVEKPELNYSGLRFRFVNDVDVFKKLEKAD